MYINTSLVPENQESTLIFIKYMHDIVLKISFLDTNSQNWSNGSHLKLLQKSLKIQYIFQKFLCTADGPDRTDFWIQKIFLFRPFLIIFQIWWIKKMPRAKKNVNIKKQFLHVRQPREGIFDICWHWCSIYTITCQSFKRLPVIQFWELMSKNEI